MSEPEWMSHAACRGHWKEGDWDDLRPADQLLVCSTCPVLTQCRADVQHLTATRTRSSSIDLDEVQWLLDGGESPAQITLRIGRSVSTIEQAARRHRRAAMAATFGRERDWAERKRAA